MIGSPECSLPSSPLRQSRELALRVVGTEHDGRILRIRSPKCTIGSAAGCTLRLKAPGVQDVHCLVLRGPGGLAVRSWSTETRLNGQTFIDSPLVAGDLLAVGPVEFEVLDTTPSEEVAAVLAEPNAPSAAESARLQQIEREAEAALEARDTLAQRLLEREEHVARLATQLAAAEQLTEQLKRDVAGAAVVATPPSVDPAELAAARQQLQKLTGELNAARTALAAERTAWEDERTALKNTVAQAAAQLEQQKQQAARDHARLATDLEKAAANGPNTVEKQRELREMEVALTHWRERADEQRLRIAELERQLQEQQQQPVVYAGDSQRLRAELEAGARELDAEAERLLEREQALEQKLVAWEAEQSKIVAEIAEQRSRLGEQASELENRLNACEEQRQLLEQQRTQLAAQATELEQQRSTFLQQVAELEQQCRDLADERAALEAQRATLLAEQERLAAERATWQQQRAAGDATELYEYTPAEQPRPTPEPAEKTPYQAQSASDIIAKLSASGLWKDDMPEEPAVATSPEPAWKALVPDEPVPSPPVAAAEEEDSIEAYMQRLLQRVSGDSAGTSRSMMDTRPAQRADTAAEIEVNELLSDRAVAPLPEEPFDFATYTPRTAPELTANLAAMRELANTSARTAIDSSSKRKQARYASSKIYLSLGAIGTAVALGWLSLRTHSVLSYYAALSAGLASLLWGMHAGYLWLKARRQNARDDYKA